jgi:hypothetical protein
LNIQRSEGGCGNEGFAPTGTPGGQLGGFGPSPLSGLGWFTGLGLDDYIDFHIDLGIPKSELGSPYFIWRYGEGALAQLGDETESDGEIVSIIRSITDTRWEPVFDENGLQVIESRNTGETFEQSVTIGAGSLLPDGVKNKTGVGVEVIYTYEVQTDHELIRQLERTDKVILTYPKDHPFDTTTEIIHAGAWRPTGRTRWRNLGTGTTIDPLSVTITKICPISCAFGDFIDGAFFGQ